MDDEPVIVESGDEQEPGTVSEPPVQPEEAKQAEPPSEEIKPTEAKTLSSQPSSQKQGRPVPSMAKADPATYDLKRLLGRDPVLSDTEAAKAPVGSKPSHAEERAAARPTRHPSPGETYTFVPVVNRPSAELRSHEEFYKSQLAYKEAVQAKTEKLKEENQKAAQDGLSFKPLISLKSIEIAQKVRTEPLHDRLMHQRAFERTLPKGTPSEEGLFSISEQPAEPRSAPKARTSTKTYEKSGSRSVLEETASEVKASENSQKVLKRRFKAEFQLHWTAVGAEETLRYFQFVELLRKLALISQDEERHDEERIQAREMWRLLVPEDEGQAAKQHVYVVLLAALGYYTPGTEPEGEHESWAGVGVLRQGKLYLKNEDVELIRRDFSVLTQLRAHLFGKQTIVEEQTFTYQPKVTARTKQLYERLKLGRVQTQAHEFLYEDALQKEEREVVRKQKIEGETTLKECTFTPQTNARSERLIGSVKRYVKDNLATEYIKLATEKEHSTRTQLLYSLSSLSKARKEKVARTQAEAEEERAKVDCTFQPVVNGGTKAAATAPPKGSDKVIERLQKAREQAAWLKAHREAGTPYHGSTKQAKSSSARITVELEVKLPSGETEVLRYQLGQDAEAVVRAFASRQGLDEASVDQLQQALVQLARSKERK